MKKTVLFLMALVMSAGFAFAATTIPASNSVPGVFICYDGVNGGGYSGATINLGSDPGVWPWSTDDGHGIAFTPVKDATYHMTFSITSTGAGGYRLRWLKDDGYDNHTSGEYAVVGNYPFTDADLVNFIPAALSLGAITNGQTVTYNCEFKLDGTQQAEGLIGNIGIRGWQGNHNFVINTIVITDADGNQLVNYDKDAIEPVTSFDFEKNAIGDTYAAYGPDDATTGEPVLLDAPATVVANPAATDDNAQSLSYTMSGYDQVILIGTVVVPTGLTLADCTGVSFDAYTDAAQYKEILMRINDEPLWGNGIYKKVSAGGSWATLSVNLTTGETTDADGNVTAKAGTKGGTSVYTDGSLTSFDFYLSLNDNALSYYLDNVVFNFEGGNGIIQVKPDVTNVYNTVGGIIVNANNEKVSIYAIDGRLVKQTIAGQGTIIPLQQGLYIVKVGAAKAVKVVVK